MTEQIGIVTGGGDCPGLNAVIRAVVKAGSRRGWSALGILGGYEGLLAPVHYAATPGGLPGLPAWRVAPT